MDQLLEACIAAPDDDAPRLAWAKQVGGERGELVSIQCALARGGLARDVAIAHRRREAELLERNESKWAGLEGLSDAFLFRRGFVDEAIVDARKFAEKGEPLFAAAPLLRCVELVGLDDGDPGEIVRLLSAALASPWFKRVRTLRLDRVGRTVETDSDMHPRDFRSAGSEALAQVIASGSLQTLQGLQLPRCCLSSSDIERLAASKEAAGLAELDLRHQGVDRYVGLYPGSVQRIVDSPNLPHLESLDIGSALGHASGNTPAQRKEASRKQAKERDPLLLQHPRIRQLRRLGIANSGFADEMIDALAEAQFERLDWLDVSRNDIFPEDFRRIGAAPGYDRLVELVFNGPSKYVFSAKIAEALGAATRLPALRVLRLRNCLMDEAAARALLSSPLARRLELIDLRNNREPAQKREALQKMFDGVLLLGD